MINLSSAILYKTSQTDAEVIVGQSVERLLTDSQFKLLAAGDSNPKLFKNGKTEIWETRGLSLAPHKLGGIGNVCPHASPACIAACLNACGMGSMLDNVQIGRLARTNFYYSHRAEFLAKLERELAAALKSADRLSKKLAVRLNVFSDIAWENTGIIDAFPRIQFYDYSKNPNRFGAIRPNYWVTFSLSEVNEAAAVHVLESADNVAIAFADRIKSGVGNRSQFQELPKTYRLGGRDWAVIDGDTTDLRFADTRGRKFGRIVGLRLKAPSNAKRAAAIESGFAKLWN